MPRAAPRPARGDPRDRWGCTAGESAAARTNARKRRVTAAMPAGLRAGGRTPVDPALRRTLPALDPLIRRDMQNVN